MIPQNAQEREESVGRISNPKLLSAYLLCSMGILIKKRRIKLFENLLNKGTTASIINLIPISPRTKTERSEDELSERPYVEIVCLTSWFLFKPMSLKIIMGLSLEPIS